MTLPKASYAMPGETPVAIRMTESELTELREHAAAARLSVSAYLRAVDGGRASEDAQAMGITRGALVRLLALHRAPMAREALRAGERRLDTAIHPLYSNRDEENQR